jgi:WD40 repeat protein/ferric-dicitrate binding protein FerR (iron transport regulator)
MNCDDIEPELPLLLERSGEDSSGREVERHLAECAACRAQADALSTLISRLQREGRADLLPRDLRSGLREGMRRPGRRLALVSGALAAATLLVLLLLPGRPPSPELLSGVARLERGRVATSEGKEAVVRLFDGSTVVLRPDTRLAARPEGGRRVVDLEQGAARFDVSPGSRVFEIRTPVGSIQVLGTRFEAALERTGLRVTVLQGLVRVANDGGAVTLAAGQGMLVTSRQAIPAPMRVDGEGDPLPEGAVARLGSARLRHGTRLSSMTVSPDGSLLVSGCEADSRVRLWSLPSGRPAGSLDLPARDVASVILSRDGKILAAAGGTTVRLWDLAERKLLESFETPKDISSMALSPDGTTLAVGCDDKTVRLWEWKTRKERAPLGGFNEHVLALAFSPKGDLLATSEYSGPTRLWSLPAGTELLKIGSVGGFRSPCVFSPDGTILACGGTRVHLFDPGTGQSKGDLSPISDPPDKNDLDSCEALAFSPDGRHLALKSQKGIGLWEVAARKRVFLFMLPDSEGPWSSLEGAVAFTPDGRRFGANVEGLVRFWELPSGTPLPAPEGHQGALGSLAVSPDGAAAATASKDGTIRLWETLTGKPLSILKDHQGGVTSVAFSPDGKRMASGDDHETVVLWDRGSLKPTRRWTGREGNIGALEILDLHFSPDSQTVSYLCGQSGLGGLLHVNDAASGAPGRALRRPKGREWPTAVLPILTEALLVCGERSGSISIWSRSSDELRSLEGHRGAVQSLAASPDGRFIVSGGEDSALILWSVDAWKKESVLRTQKPVRTVAVSPDGRKVASGGDDGVVRLWEVATGLELAAWSGHDGKIQALVFTADGKSLLSASADGTGLVWGLDEASAGAAPPLDASWAALGGQDGRAAFRATGDLVRGGAATLAFLKERLVQPLPTVTPAVKRLVADLDRDDPAVRERASEELRALGEEIEGELLGALAAQASPEARTRLRSLLGGSEGSLAVRASGARLFVRAIEVLERIGSESARALLRDLAAGAPFVKARRAASESLRRLR